MYFALIKTRGDEGMRFLGTGTRESEEACDRRNEVKGMNRRKAAAFLAGKYPVKRT